MLQTLALNKILQQENPFLVLLIILEDFALLILMLINTLILSNKLILIEISCSYKLAAAMCSIIQAVSIIHLNIFGYLEKCASCNYLHINVLITMEQSL